ncbi:hypothetical protein HQN87_10160 [Paenibacillus tritici]|uniref:Uncharacterized protein n=1 Tax=Paenibacillus tritici TaxID=1873425 RepID=A0ABX2DNL0_9BACL|nr:hypothetical protein [Paenibacillus tritici]NQX45694.1 hypothetical protein [Paenibacillus tritici]
MRLLPFERPTEHYDERIVEIDKEICSLIQQRKDVSDDNPGYPPFEYISEWSETFELYEDFLKVLFATMMNEKQFKPRVEPSGFRKHIEILRSVEKDERFYTLTSLRQYSNASVLVLNIDWDEQPDNVPNSHQHTHYELFINEQYDSRMTSGASSSDHASYKYVVTPPLPDDISELQFRFGPYNHSFKKAESEDEIVFGIM